MSNVISSGNKEYVTIKIDTNMLIEMFEDINGDYFRVKNKERFAVDIANEIEEYLMNEVLENVIDMFAESESCSLETVE